jgi:putative acetyltransferase
MEARSLRPGADLILTSEQHARARRFYESRGFVVEGRSEVDAEGLPFPLIHMRAAATP